MIFHVRQENVPMSIMCSMIYNLYLMKLILKVTFSKISYIYKPIEKLELFIGKFFIRSVKTNNFVSIIHLFLLTYRDFF